MVRFLVFLIGLSLAIQNTCPYGWAAKTAFISPDKSQCSHCPLKSKEGTKPDAGNDFKKDISSLNDIFVLDLGGHEPLLKFFSPLRRTIATNNHRAYSVFLEPLLRPPVFFPS